MSGPSQYSERTRQQLEVARQLARVLAAHRLFPEDPRQEGFVTAVERARQAAETALATGPVSIEIRRGIIRIGTEAFTGDQTLERLGAAAFDRRVEHIGVYEVPSDEDLLDFSRVLSRPVELASTEAEPQEWLRDQGVTSISVSAVAPDEIRDPREVERLLGEKYEIWRLLSNPQELAATLAEDLPDDDAAAAEVVYQEFHQLFGAVPGAVVAREDFFRNVRRVLEALPGPVSREFVARIVTRVSSDSFANAYIVDMTDTDLAEALLELQAESGPDARDTAQKVLGATGRAPTALHMIDRAAAGEITPERLADSRPTMAALARSPDETMVRQNVADALSVELLAGRDEDLGSVQSEWPTLREEYEAQALEALRDYLTVETDLVRLAAVLDRWRDAARDALRNLDEARLEQLFGILRDPMSASADPERTALFRGAQEGVVTTSVVGALVSAGQGEDRAVAVRDVLRRFDELGLQAVLDLLAVEEDRGVRAELVGLAAELAEGHVEVIEARLDDPRWYVVRNLVTILGRAGDQHAMSALVKLLSHRDAHVRTEVLRTLQHVAGPDAIPYIQRLSKDRDDAVRTAAVNALVASRAPQAATALADIVRNGERTEERRRALEALATHPSASAGPLLDELADRSTRPKLPRQLRRAAKQAARTRRAG